MKYLTFICFIFCFCSTIAQNKIINKETKVPVEFAAIYNVNSKEGTYSDENGQFNLNSNNKDSLIISCIGYYTDTVPYNSLMPIVLLEPKIYSMEEIVYSIDVKSIESELGYRKERKILTFYSHIGSEWLVYIENPKPNKNQVIETIILKTYNRSKKDVGFRINIYAKDSITNLPNNKVLATNIYRTNDHKGNKFELSTAIIFPKSGVFVGIEWISYLNNEGKKISTKGDIRLSVPLTFNVERPLTFYRSKFYENKWLRADNNHPLSQLMNSDNPPNLAASIIVKEYINE